MSLWYKFSCKRSGRRQVEPGSGWVVQDCWTGLFDRMASAHTPICLQIALGCAFLQGSFVGVGWGYISILCIVECIFCLDDSLSRCPSGGTSQFLANNSFWVQPEIFMALVGFEPSTLSVMTRHSPNLSYPVYMLVLNTVVSCRSAAANTVMWVVRSLFDPI